MNKYILVYGSMDLVQTRRACQPLARRWPKASRVGAIVFSKILDTKTMYDPQSWIPMSHIFSPTTNYGVHEGAKVMYASSKFDPPCLTFFCLLLNMVHVNA